MHLEAKVGKLLALREQVSSLERELAADLHLNGFAAPLPAVAVPVVRRAKRRAKITPELIQSVRTLKRKHSRAEIAKSLGISPATVNYILYVKKG